VPGAFLRHIAYEECLPDASKCHQQLPAYEGLAPLWHEHARNSLPDYPGFLADWGRDKRTEIRSVLDLACGDGTLTTRFCSIAPTVVGLGVNEAMLSRARTLATGRQNVTFVRGDFRDFQLNACFDAVTCASNSLNYVANLGELSRTFRGVADHLNPGGLFVFDTFTEVGMRFISGQYFHSLGEVGNRFVLAFQYDPVRRVETSVAHLARGCETHIRTPIDPKDVAKAIKGTELEIEEYFAFDFWPLKWSTGPQCCFVLTRR
jgi:SAM-dependent methyltransferase